MSRFFTTARCLGVFVLVAIGLVGCDQTPSSVDEFEVQGTMDSPSALVVTPDLEPQFTVEYQGLTEPPTIEASDRIGIESVGEAEGDPRNGGSKSWRLTLATDDIDQLLVQDPVLIRGNETSGGEVVDTLSATVTTSLSVQTDFTSSFYTVADFEGDVTVDNYELEESFTADTLNTEPYEGEQRIISGSGGTEFALTNPDPEVGIPDPTNDPSGSNGIRFMEVTASSGGSLTIERRMNLPNSNFFSFLLRQASSNFTLTITMVEETDGGTVNRELSLPIPAGSQWLKIGVPFGFFGEEFNPVDPRSGGNGPLVSIRLSADQNVQYAVDELLFGVGPTEQEPFRPRAEFHDFEETTLAFGPPINTGNTYTFSTVGVDSDPMVPDSSDGYTARGVAGSSTWGYDFGGGAFGSEHNVKVDVEGDDVLSFLVKDRSGASSFDITIQSDGGFSNSVTVDDLPEGEWERVEIPISSFGSSSPGAALDPGIKGFNIANGEGSDILMDDIKIMPK